MPHGEDKTSEGREPLPAALVTPTVAEIYLKQGHTGAALEIYRQLAAREPDNAALRRRITVLEQRVEREAAEAALLGRIERLKRLLRRVQRRRRLLDAGRRPGGGG